MRKLTVPFAAAVAAVLLTLAVTSMTSKAADTSYAEDRSAIEDLQARYLFAMDFGDPDLYVTTFTEDGILDVGSGEIRGRKAIHEVIAKMPNSRTTENGLRPASGRHNISNIVIKVSDGKATASLKAFSIVVSSSTATGSATLSWTPPTQNSNGTTLTNLAGYRIYYGKSASTMTQLITVANPGTARYVVDDLTAATWYFNVRAYSTTGVESAASNTATKTVQ